MGLLGDFGGRKNFMKLSLYIFFIWLGTPRVGLHFSPLSTPVCATGRGIEGEQSPEEGK